MAVPPESPQEAATFLSAFDAGLTEATGQADRAEHGDVTDGRHE